MSDLGLVGSLPVLAVSRTSLYEQRASLTMIDLACVVNFSISELQLKHECHCLEGSLPTLLVSKISETVSVHVLCVHIQIVELLNTCHFPSSLCVLWDPESQACIVFNHFSRSFYQGVTLELPSIARCRLCRLP